MYDDIVQKYIEKICSYVKWKEYHLAIKTELLNHINDNVNDLITQGKQKNEALSLTLNNLGDPEILGKQLNESYKPKYNKIQIFGFFSLIIFFLLAEYWAILKVTNDYLQMIEMLVIFFLGSSSACLLFIVNWSDNNKLSKFWIQIFISVIFFFAFVFLVDAPIKIKIVKEMMLLIPTIGCYLISTLKDKKIVGFIITVFLFILPITISYNMRIYSSMIILSVCAWVILLLMIRHDWLKFEKKEILYGCISCSLIGVLIYMTNIRIDNIVFNIDVFFIKDIIKGSLIRNDSRIFDYPITLLISNCGYGVLILYTLFIIILSIEIIKIYNKQNNLISKLIIMSILISFILEFIFSLLLNLGIPLAKGFDAPFLDFDLGFIIKMIQIGIVKKLDCYGNYIFSNYPDCKLFDIEKGKIIIYYR